MRGKGANSANFRPPPWRRRGYRERRRALAFLWSIFRSNRIGSRHPREIEDDGEAIRRESPGIEPACNLASIVLRGMCQALGGHHEYNNIGARMGCRKTATGIVPNAVGASPARLPSLDGLRGILAVVVMLAHYGVVNGNGQLLLFARLAVYAFFMISAYALTVSWGAPYWVFMTKRVLRLWPVYAVTLTFGMVVTRNGLQWSDYFWVPFKGFHDWLPQNPVAWSLYVEIYASAAMPLIIAVSARIWTALIAAFALVVAARFQSDLIFGVFFIAGSYATRFKFDVAFLNSALPQWLGKISYSLYLCHCGVLMVCMGAMPFLWVYVSIPLCFLTASSIYVAIEKPSIDLSRRFARWGNKNVVKPVMASEFGPT